MKSLDDDGSASGSGSDSEDGSDSESGSGSDSDEESSGGGSVPDMDTKLSNNFSFDKKTKLIKCNTSSWMTAIGKKHCIKFTIELGASCSSLMLGFIPKAKFNQSGSNYNNGHCWYATSSGLYGNNKINNNSSFQGAGNSQGTKLGAAFDKKKRNYFFL